MVVIVMYRHDMIRVLDNVHHARLVATTMEYTACPSPKPATRRRQTIVQSRHKLR